MEWSFLALNMERRQASVAALVQLERLLGSSDAGVDSALVNRILSQVPDERVREAARGAVSEYRAIIRNAAAEEQLLRRIATELCGEASPDSLGTLLFSARTGKVPVGPIALVRREGYLILNCPNPADYNLFTDPQLPYRAGDDFKVKIEALLQHGGTFHSTLVLNPAFVQEHVGAAGTISTSVIVIKSSEGAYGYDEVLAHERQHFINHRLLGLFRRGERTKTADGPLETAARTVKDEVIAFVRDGTTGSQINLSLSGSVYAHLYDQLPAEEADALRSGVALIGSRIDLHPVFTEPESRQALAMQLVDIPFSRIPDAIPTIAEYYQKRWDALESIALPKDLVSDGMSMSPVYSTERMRLRASLAAYYRLKGECVTQAFSSTTTAFSASLENLRVRRASVVRDMDSLRIGGIPIPSGTYFFQNAEKKWVSTPPRLEVVAKESFQEILTRLTVLSTSMRTDFVRMASEPSDSAFSNALEGGISDAIVRPLMGRGAERIEILNRRKGGRHDPNSVYVGVEATFPRLDGLHKVILSLLIHGKPERPEPVFKS